MDYDYAGDPIPFCGSSMYMGSDGHCHYYDTDGGSAYKATPTYVAPKKVDPCSYDGLSEAYASHKAKGEVMEGLSSKTWWSQCPQDIRESVYRFIESASTVNTIKASSSSKSQKAKLNLPSCSETYGYASIYDQTKGSCVCLAGYVLSNNTCEPAFEYCADRGGVLSIYNSTTNSCDCMAGTSLINGTCDFSWNTSTSSKSSSSSSSVDSALQRSAEVCGPGSYYSPQSGCVCKLGYEKAGLGCVFSDCPSGYQQIGDECRILDVHNSIACVSKNPCKCKKGYVPLGNQKCVKQ